MYQHANENFIIPSAAAPYIGAFLTEDEIKAICAMERRHYTAEELASLLHEKIAGDAETFLKTAYSRGVLNKAIDDEGRIFYCLADFYTRLAFFAQYEPELWEKIPEKARAEIDEWYVAQYLAKARPRLEAALKGEGLIENAFFFSLDETLALIDSLENDPYVVPCNCKAAARKCEKPRNVCIAFNRGINSEWDRGHGTPLTKEEAKKLVISANKSGLMQTSETAAAICNCCGDCCYPIRASKILGTQGIWPKKLHEIEFNAEKCVKCGKCVKICNFGAFKKVDGKILFEETACWGCTICASNCPAGAISIKKTGGEGRVSARHFAPKGEMF